MYRVCRRVARPEPATGDSAGSSRVQGEVHGHFVFAIVETTAGCFRDRRDDRCPALDVFVARARSARTGPCRDDRRLFFAIVETIAACTPCYSPEQASSRLRGHPVAGGD